MNTSVMNQYYQWVVTSARVMAHLRTAAEYELEEDGPLSRWLTAGNGQSQVFNFPALESRLSVLAFEKKAKHVLVVVEKVDAEFLSVLDNLPNALVERLDLRYVNWGADPIGTVDLMNAEFVEAVETVPVPDESSMWRRYPLYLMAASTPEEENGAISKQDIGIIYNLNEIRGRHGVTTKATLKLTKSARKNLHYLDITVPKALASNFVGYHVVLEVDEETIAVGLFDEDGWVGCRLDQPIDLKQSLSLLVQEKS